MSDFSVRSDSVDVEQIMRQIRSRIREKRGVDYTEEEIRELANVKLDRFIDPKGVRSGLLDEYRRVNAAAPPPPNYAFGEDTLFETHRAPIRWLRALLRPFLKLLFNPNPLIQALHIQADLNQRNAERWARLDALHYELIHNLVVEVTRSSLEVKSLKMRLESMASRLDFDERRARALEGVVQYRPGAVAPLQPPTGQDRDRGSRGGQRNDRDRRDRDQRPQGQRPPQQQQQRSQAPAAEGAPVAQQPQPGVPADQPAANALDNDGNERRSRRRRRRGRRRSGGGDGAATADSRYPITDASGSAAAETDVATDTPNDAELAHLSTSDVEARTSAPDPSPSDIGYRASDIGYRASDIEPPTSDVEPRTSNVEPRTSDLGPRTPDLEPRTSDLGPRTSDADAAAAAAPEPPPAPERDPQPE
jgi:hypothetical protein